MTAMGREGQPSGRCLARMLRCLRGQQRALISECCLLRKTKNFEHPPPDDRIAKCTDHPFAGSTRLGYKRRS